MYYLELIERFWLFNQNNHIGSTAVAMYFYLLKTGHINDRYDFKLSDVVVSKELSLTRKTVGVIREKLKRSGLIEFRTRNGLPCHYRLLLNYPLICEEPQVSLIELLNISDHNGILDINKGISQNEIELGSQILKSENNKSVEPHLPSFYESKQIPSFDEFLDYAKKLDGFIPELNPKIKEKYGTWSDNGWLTSSNRPITNWRSSLKAALPFMLDSNDHTSFSSAKVPVIKREKDM